MAEFEGGLAVIHVDDVDDEQLLRGPGRRAEVVAGDQCGVLLDGLPVEWSSRFHVELMTVLSH